MKTLDHSKFLAKTAVEILWSEGDLFRNQIDKDSLVENLTKKFLVKLVETDSDILENHEFEDCLQRSKIKPERA